MLDNIILLDIYPAREKPIENVNSEMLLKLIKHKKKHLCQKKDLINYIDSQPTEIVLTMGAGDIDQMVKPVEDFFIAKYNLTKQYSL